jgi:epoxyqueuosine reductase
VISVLYNYYTDKQQKDPEAPVISKYAYGKDYHMVMKDLLFELFAFIKTLQPETSGRVFVDSAPVLDRAWARKAGLGWIGRNSCLISRSAGSFVFIGEIILDLELEYNKFPESDFCGSCNRCVEACPTGALLNERTLDSERCISYQTIENRGEVSSDLKNLLSGRVFGCDICQDVCPWNRKAVLHTEPQFEPSDALMEKTAEQWEQLDEKNYEKLFKDSPLERAGYTKLRNTLDILQK